MADQEKPESFEQRMRRALNFHEEKVAQLESALRYYSENKDGAEALMRLMQRGEGWY